MIKERNNVVDAIRGVAILLVVLGHIMTGLVVDVNKTFLYNIIFSLQMPLFMLISGYVSQYSKPIVTAKDLLIFIKRRSIAYLLPLVVWTIIRDFNVSFVKLVFQIDITYWFLFSIWTISIILGVSQYLANKMVKNDRPIVREIFTTCFYVAGAVLLIVIGVLVSFSFLGFRLTLYYMPFFLMGYLYGKLKPYIEKIKHEKIITEIIVAVFAIAHAYLLKKYDFADCASGLEQAIRFIASAIGCIAIASLLSKVFIKYKKIESVFSFVGKQSLEIYLVHYFAIFFTTRFNDVQFDTLEGVLTVFASFAIAMTITLILINVFNKNKFVNFILFGKTK